MSHGPEEAKNTLIDEINCFYESICSKLDLIYIDNKRVTCDMYGNLNDQVFYDDVHLRGCLHDTGASSLWFPLMALYLFT